MISIRTIHSISNINPIITYFSSPIRSMTIISNQSKQEHSKLNYNERMQHQNKHISPHLLIYKFPITALSSITNRIMACLLSGTTSLLAMTELTYGNGSALMAFQSVSLMSPCLVGFMKFNMSYPLVYHYVCSIRHFIWDTFPHYMNNMDAAKSSYFLFGISLLISGGLVCM